VRTQKLSKGHEANLPAWGSLTLEFFKGEFSSGRITKHKKHNGISLIVIKIGRCNIFCVSCFGLG
jgi:hypothetical protein